MFSLKFLFFLTCLLLASAAQAQTSRNLRILFHGTKEFQDSKDFGLAGWVVVSNVTKNPNKWLFVLGPRRSGDDWWVETMVGVSIQDGQSISLFDVRASLTTFKPLTVWTNLELIEGGSFYAYFQTDYVLAEDVGSIGLETENVFRKGKDTICLGPHLVIPFNVMTLVAAYQFHQAAADQVWLRMVVSF